MKSLYLHLSILSFKGISLLYLLVKLSWSVYSKNGWVTTKLKTGYKILPLLLYDVEIIQYFYTIIDES